MKSSAWRPTSCSCYDFNILVNVAWPRWPARCAWRVRTRFKNMDTLPFFAMSSTSIVLHCCTLFSISLRCQNAKRVRTRCSRSRHVSTPAKSVPQEPPLSRTPPFFCPLFVYVRKAFDKDLSSHNTTLVFSSFCFVKVPGVRYVPMVGKVTVAMLERNLLRLHENFGEGTFTVGICC